MAREMKKENRERSDMSGEITLYPKMHFRFLKGIVITNFQLQYLTRFMRRHTHRQTRNTTTQYPSSTTDSHSTQTHIPHSRSFDSLINTLTRHQNTCNPGCCRCENRPLSRDFRAYTWRVLEVLVRYHLKDEVMEAGEQCDETRIKLTHAGSISPGVSATP